MRENSNHAVLALTLWIFDEINRIARHLSLFGPIRESDRENLIAHPRLASFVKLICIFRW